MKIYDTFLGLITKFMDDIITKTFSADETERNSEMIGISANKMNEMSQRHHLMNPTLSPLGPYNS